MLNIFILQVLVYKKTLFKIFNPIYPNNKRPVHVQFHLS